VAQTFFCPFLFSLLSPFTIRKWKWNGISGEEEKADFDDEERKTEDRTFLPHPDPNAFRFNGPVSYSYSRSKRDEPSNVFILKIDKSDSSGAETPGSFVLAKERLNLHLTSSSSSSF